MDENNPDFEKTTEQVGQCDEDTLKSNRSDLPLNNVEELRTYLEPLLNKSLPKGQKKKKKKKPEKSKKKSEATSENESIEDVEVLNDSIPVQTNGTDSNDKGKKKPKTLKRRHKKNSSFPYLDEKSRTVSPYSIFVYLLHGMLMKVDEELSFSQRTILISNIWAMMSQKDKEPFVQAANYSNSGFNLNENDD